MDCSSMKLLWIFSLIQIHYVDLQSVVLRLDPPDDDGYIISGTSFTLQCEANDTAMDSQLNLTKDGTLIVQVDVNESSTNSMEFSGVILYTIDDLQQNETGTYCCILDRVDCIQIHIIESPVGNVSTIPETTNAIQKEVVTLSCLTSSGPNNEYVWLYTPSCPVSNCSEGISVFDKTDDEIKAITTGLENQIAIIINTAQDGGEYVCVVTNEAGIDKSTSTIQVLPYFTVVPHDIEVVVGSSVSLSCMAEGFPDDVTLQWQKELLPIMGEVNEILLFSQISFSDAGAYQCIATNSAGVTFSEEITVTVILEVNVTGDAFVENENELNLTCTASANPENVFVWTLNDKEIMEEQYDISFTAYTDNSIYSSILMIRSINASIHKGIYKCTVNITGVSGEAMINVIVSPRGTVTTSPETFIASQNNRGITFNCQTDAHQNSTVYVWLYNKDNFLCSQSDCPNGIFVFNRNDAEIINATVSISPTLNLNSITASKGGEYVCVVSNGAGNGSSTSFLYIEPYFTVEPTDTEVDIAATFTLNCEVEAYPEVMMLQWQKFDNNSMEYADVNGEDGMELTINNALINDTGTYRCVASNSILGLVYVANSRTVTVTVNGALSVNSSHYTVSYIIMTVLLTLYSL